jgi:hypothetical protein
LAISPPVWVRAEVWPRSRVSGVVFFRISHLRSSSSIRFWTSMQACLVAWVRTMVLSETRLLRASLTLNRVLREGLELGECLGMTWPGRRPGGDFLPHPWLSRILVSFRGQ